jgi:hypothetical protein
MLEDAPLSASKKGVVTIWPQNLKSHSLCPEFSITIAQAADTLVHPPPGIEAAMCPLKLGVLGHVEALTTLMRF